MEHVSAYLKAADDQGLLPLFFLQLVTGLRKMELIALIWSDLDLEYQTLSVSKQLTARDGKSQITRSKTETSIRQISVSQEAIDLLIQEYKKHPDNLYMFLSPKMGGMYHPDSVVNLDTRKS